MHPTFSPPAKAEMLTRPPIVVVMGHIDHGKTTLLDWYRNARVAASEAGGITQHVGAYEIERQGKKITFLDTPGHEAFAAIRTRGAALADIALLVIAADEGIKPQTKEALSVIRARKLPFIVVLNKSDKTDADPERVKQQLAGEEILVESYGGKIPAVQVSAKEGSGMEELLETVFLMAELEPHTADITKPAEGVVIEVRREARRGSSALIIVKDGTLHNRDFLVINGAIEKIKIMEDAFGATLSEARPSLPIRITGLSVLPEVGSTFSAFPTRIDAETAATSFNLGLLKSEPNRQEEKLISVPSHVSEIALSLVIKADTAGSKEAIQGALQKLQIEGVALKVLSSDIGDVNENDVKRAATSTPRLILAFGVKIDSAARELARNLHVEIIVHPVIYELIDKVHAYMKELQPVVSERSALGKITLLKVFRQEGSKNIIGGRVEEGVARQGAFVEIVRRKTVIGEGVIKELQQDRRPATEVHAGSQCGILLETKAELREGDALTLLAEQKRIIEPQSGQNAS